MYLCHAQGRDPELPRRAGAAARREENPCELRCTRAGLDPAHSVHHAARPGEGVRQEHAARATGAAQGTRAGLCNRSEEHTSELQSLMRISYAVFCLKKKKSHTATTYTQIIRNTAR